MNQSQNHYLYQTERLGLKRLGPEELGGAYPYWFADEQVHQHNSHFRMPNTVSQVRRYVEGLEEDTTALVFAVYWLDKSLHIGNIAVQSIDMRHRSAELAFLFGEKDYWNKGVGFEATQKVIEHCQKYMNLRRLHLGCFKGNSAMCRLAEKLGFEQEGCLKSALYGNGKYNDVVLYGLLM